MHVLLEGIELVEFVKPFVLFVLRVVIYLNCITFKVKLAYTWTPHECSCWFFLYFFVINIAAADGFASATWLPASHWPCNFVESDGNGKMLFNYGSQGAMKESRSPRRILGALLWRLDAGVVGQKTKIIS
jgi:hypothetical protein